MSAASCRCAAWCAASAVFSRASAPKKAIRRKPTAPTGWRARAKPNKLSCGRPGQWFAPLAEYRPYALAPALVNADEGPVNFRREIAEQNISRRMHVQRWRHEQQQ